MIPLVTSHTCFTDIFYHTHLTFIKTTSQTHFTPYSLCSFKTFLQKYILKIDCFWPILCRSQVKINWVNFEENASSGSPVMTVSPPTISMLSLYQHTSISLYLQSYVMCLQKSTSSDQLFVLYLDFLGRDYVQKYQ